MGRGVVALGFVFALWERRYKLLATLNQLGYNVAGIAFQRGRMPAVSTWILVADASQARLFAGRKKNEPWTLIQTLEHPESRAKNHELITDRPGRTQQSGGTPSSPDTASPGKGSRSGMEVEEPKHVEQKHFAQLLADMLAKGVLERACEALMVVAPPHFLGLLRERFTDPVQKVLHSTIDKNYTALAQKELEERLHDAWLFV